jgi:hypothetical protein
VHRVKKELLQKDFCEGGLKMINLNLFILALKTTRVRKLFRTECKLDTFGPGELTKQIPFLFL